MAEVEFFCKTCNKNVVAEPDVSGIITCPGCGTQFITDTNLNKTQAMSENAPDGFSEDMLPSEKTALPPGTDVNGFEIVRLVGLGGMGSVYLAIQKSMQREVALKLLNPNVTRDAEAVEQFLKEVRNSGKLQHPNIVSAYDAGKYNDNYYLAMQFVKGDTLDNIIEKQGPLTELKALQVIVQIATALDYVWSKFNMFHRDIKPGNFMLNEDGAAMLMDMGIAQGLGDWKEDGAIEGSPYYMSPEQIRGEKLSWTTDQYSLGASLFQLITGQMPFDAESIEGILQKHCDAPVPKAADRGVTVSTQTQAMIDRMMSKFPSQRFPSWQAVIKQANSIISSMTCSKPQLKLNLNLNKPAEAAPAVGKPAIEKPVQTEKTKEKEEKTPVNLKKFLIPISIAAGILIVVAGVGIGGYFGWKKVASSSASQALAELKKCEQEFQTNSDAVDAYAKASSAARAASGKALIDESMKKDLLSAADSADKNIKQAQDAAKAFNNTAENFKKTIADVQAEFEKSTGTDQKTLQKLSGLDEKLKSEQKKVSAAAGNSKKLKEKISSDLNKAEQLLKNINAKKQEVSAVIAKKAKEEAAKKAALAAKKKQEEAARKKAEEEKRRKAEAAKKQAVKPAQKPVVKPTQKPAPKQVVQQNQTSAAPKTVAQAIAKFRADFGNVMFTAYTTHNYDLVLKYRYPGYMASVKPKAPLPVKKAEKDKTAADKSKEEADKAKFKKENEELQNTQRIYNRILDYTRGAKKTWAILKKFESEIKPNGTKVTIVSQNKPLVCSYRGFKNGMVITDKGSFPFSELASRNKFEMVLSIQRKAYAMELFNGNDFAGFFFSETMMYGGKRIFMGSSVRNYAECLKFYAKPLKDRAQRDPKLKNRLQFEFRNSYNTFGNQ